MPIPPSPRRYCSTLPTSTRRAIVLALGPLLALIGCSGSDASYPSLASRPIERLSDATPPPAPVATNTPPAAPSAALTAQLQQLVERARSAHHDFVGQRAGAERQVNAAGAAPIGSEDWARATQALSGLESARSLTAQSLADLDRLETDDRVAHPAPGLAQPDAQAIAHARDTVAALIAEEDAVLVKLNGRRAG